MNIVYLFISLIVNKLIILIMMTSKPLLYFLNFQSLIYTLSLIASDKYDQQVITEQ